MAFFVPIEGSSTACAACSSLTGVLNQVFFSFVASGESSAVATVHHHHYYQHHFCYERVCLRLCVCVRRVSEVMLILRKQTYNAYVFSINIYNVLL